MEKDIGFTSTMWECRGNTKGIYGYSQLNFDRSLELSCVIGKVGKTRLEQEMWTLGEAYRLVPAQVGMVRLVWDTHYAT